MRINSDKNIQIAKEILLSYLKAFSILEEGEIQLIINETNFQFFKKGTILLSEGQFATKCYLVLKGCVREYCILNEEEKTTAFFTEGQSIAPLTSMKTNIPSRLFLVCTEDCFVTVSNQQHYEELIAKIPRLESIIRVELEKDLGKERDDIARFMTSTPEERYLYLIENRPDLLNRVPLHQIASYIGIKPESLSRIRKRIIRKH